MVGRSRVFILLLCLLSACSYTQKELIGKEAPVVRLTMFDGNYTAVSRRSGPTVLSFWRMGCPYSRGELSDYNEVAEETEARGVSFIAINIDDSDKFDEVEKYIAEEKLYSLKHAFSGNGYYDEAFLTLKPERLPTYYFIKDGKVVYAGSSLGKIEDLLE